MKVAVPWSLSHYIPLNAFHPLYRALFDHAPAEIDLHAWDNVKLHRHFASIKHDRDIVSRLAIRHAQNSKVMTFGTIAHSYATYFYPPDRVLTETLPGDLEFHHTAPFPSLRRPFVFHCESFAPVFFPLMHQGQGRLDKFDELRRHYRGIFTSPLCLGIYSHIPETLESFSTFFTESKIDAKLFESKIGLSRTSVGPTNRLKGYTNEPRFLFINSAHQQPANFFNRGGHVVLRFWKEFRTAGREGKLILRCRRPDDVSLASHGVDPAFIRSELGRSILWAEGYLANHEINSLMADAHFFLLPSASLHSASILLAMTLGTLPVVTDTIGTSVYVTDRETAIVLKGVREEIWHRDPRTGVLVDYYKRMPNVTSSLVKQLVERVFELLDSKDAYIAISKRTAERARKHFSGEAFASDFWDSVNEKALLAQDTQGRSGQISELTRSLSSCVLDRDAWSRVFESTTQPMPLIDTGTSKVYELGGAKLHIFGNQEMELTDWSVFARHFNPNGPETTFATTLAGLGELFLAKGSGNAKIGSRRWRRRISNALIPYPRIHGFVARRYRAGAKEARVALLWLQYMNFKLGRIGSNDYILLVMENVNGFNIIRSFHKYYAIPQSEGAFILSKAERRQYSRTYCAYTLEAAVAKVRCGTGNDVRMFANIPIINALLRWIGEHWIRAAINVWRRNRNMQR
jgi:glycosyltransferase involved in cell wall biosynthesis